MNRHTVHASLVKDGFFVIKGVLSSELVTACRAGYASLPPMARAEYGWQAQRYQPLSRAPDFQEDLLARIKEQTSVAMSQVFPKDYTCCDASTCGVLLNPGTVSNRPDQVPRDYVMPLHRDWFNQKPHADVAHLLRSWWKQTCWYQFNLAVYKDASLFVVPGSHRYIDLADEAKRSQGPRYLLSATGSDSGFIDNYWRTQCETAGAQQVILEPGDMVIYHAGMLHGSANWVDRPRITIHEYCETTEFRQFRAQQMAAWAVGKSAGAAPWWQRDAFQLKLMSISAT